VIELIDFSKTYFSQRKTENPAVSDISFLCPDSSVTGLVGENGSGKSTILKAVSANHYATKGKVLVSDREGNVFDASDKPEKIKRICGYVPEFPVLPVEMKVSDFLLYVASLFFDDRKLAEKALEEAAVKCSMESVLNKKIKTLSKGFRQRVSFAQALISDPSILVLDEPFSGLDPAQIIQMRNLIQEEAKNKSVLLSTHNLSEVHNLCNLVLVMKNGKLAAKGTEEEIIKNTDSRSFEEAFLKL